MPANLTPQYGKAEDEYRKAREDYGDGSFDAEMGAEAVRKMLAGLELVSLSQELRKALAETGSKQKQKDLINRRSWPEKNECRSAIFEWIEVFYNRVRLHTTIGSYAPEEFESLRLSTSKEAA